MRFRILGPLAVGVADEHAPGPAVRLGGAKQQKFLACLLLQPNRVVSTDSIVDAIWVDDPPPTAIRQIRNAVSGLRRILAVAGVVEPGASIVSDHHGYRLPVTAADLDSLRFTALVDDARRARDADRPAAVTALRQALALWRGPALDGIDSPALSSAAAVWNRHRLSALEQRVDLELELGRHGEIAAELSGLVAEHPLHERFRGQLMLALYRLGQPAAALELYQQTRRLLIDELGLEPGEQLRELERRLLRRDPELDLRAPVTAGASVGPVPAELPADVVDFTGRAEHLSQLDTLAGGDLTAVVISAISGMAGVGKTALAVHWAHRSAVAYPDGQLYVNLRGYGPGEPMRPLDALAGFLRALGVPGNDVPLVEHEASALFRSRLAGRRVLVLLDNARSADQVRPLLPGEPRCLVLVTSRDRLSGLIARDSARRLSVDVLDPAEALGLLAGIVGEHRVAAEPAAAAELAAACGHLPLALRVAAANVADRPHQTIAAQVAALHAGRLAALAIDNDETAAVRAAFDRSHAALAPDAARLYALLGLVPGPDFTAESAAALADVTPAAAAATLDRLAGAHLLEQQAPGRYTFHDLLRDYAAERAQADLDADDRSAALTRLLDHYLDHAVAAVRVLAPDAVRLVVRPVAVPTDFADPALCNAWLDDELPNLVAAVRHAAGHGPASAAWLLADALRAYFHLRRNNIDWLTVASAGLATAESAGDLTGQAAAHLSIGQHGLYCLNNHQLAASHWTKALDLSRAAGWTDGQAGLLGNLGTVYHLAGDLTTSSEYYQAAIDLREQNAGPRYGTVRLNLALNYLGMGELDRAVEQSEHAIEVFREASDHIGAAAALNNLAEACRLLGRFDDAATHAGEALATARRVGDVGEELLARIRFADLHNDAGRRPEAVEAAQAALDLARRHTDRHCEADAANVLGTIHRQLGDPELAVGSHQQALAIAREMGIRETEAAALVGLAAAKVARGDAASALADGREALAISRSGGFRVLEGGASTAVAAAHRLLGDTEAATRAVRQAVGIHRATGYRLGAAIALLEQAKIIADESDAGRRHGQAELILNELGLLTTTEIRAITLG